MILIILTDNNPYVLLSKQYFFQVSVNESVIPSQPTEDPL